MELRQSRPFGVTQVQGRKATHDFLSLSSHSSFPQDPRASHGDFLETHNFLQPLDGGLKNDAKDNIVDIDLKLPSAAPSTRVVEHVLPGGIGTYSISCLPYTTQKVPKSEENGLQVVSVTSNDINDSNFSSYTGGSFMLLDESTTKRGHSRTTKNGHSRMDNLGHINLVKEPLKNDTSSLQNSQSTLLGPNVG